MGMVGGCPSYGISRTAPNNPDTSTYNLLIFRRPNKNIRNLKDHVFVRIRAERR